MSHSWEGQNGTKIVYNPDLSEVVVMHPPKRRPNGYEIDGEDILEFVAHYIRGCKMSRIEQMDTAELLGLTTAERMGSH
jgi:hypothetical protein